jgi:hypothetical protein
MHGSRRDRLGSPTGYVHTIRWAVELDPVHGRMLGKRLAVEPPLSINTETRSWCQAARLRGP